MADHLITTKMSIGKCARCGAYVLTGQTGGVKYAADPTELDMDGYRAALMAGKTTYRVMPYRDGQRLEPETGGLLFAQGSPVLASHSCGASPLDAPKVKELPEKPPVSPCDAWQAQGWTPPPNCPQRLSDGRVGSCGVCAPPPFDPDRGKDHKYVDAPGQPKCCECGYRIDKTERYWGLYSDRWIFAVHDGKCPERG